MAEKKQPAKPPMTFYIATGRRKTSVARVRLTEGRGNIVINDRPVDQYFSEDKDRAAVLSPLKITDQLTRLDVFVKTNGGGITGQSGAICQGLARALKTMFSPTSEQKRHTFNNTTVIKSYQDEKKAREKAKAPTIKPPAPVLPAGPRPALVTPLVPSAAPAAPLDPADIATGMIKKLRDSGYLTRDARMKERKKYGLRGARRGTQFSKR
jgi:small subunit ribosomal protein S9